MVVMPPNFMATKYPGYYWNVETKKLYSIKVGGVLRPLVSKKPSRWNQLPCETYTVSVDGRRRWLSVDYLNKLTYADSMIGVMK